MKRDFGALRHYNHRAYILLRKMPDNAERLEIVSEGLVLVHRDDEEEPEVVASVHRCGHQVEIKLPAKFEGVALERYLVGIQLHAKSGV